VRAGRAAFEPLARGLRIRIQTGPICSSLAVEPAAEVHSMAKSRKKSVETTPTSGSPQRAAISSQDAGTATAVVERDRIAERAYELYIRRGGGSGRELDDWLAAERELTLSSRGNGGE
jgi:Protein of unknown function (DUF2934)